METEVSDQEMVGGSGKLKGLLSADLPRGQIAQKSSGRENSYHEDLLVKLEKELLELEELKKQGGPNKLKDMPEHHTFQMLDSGSGSGKKIVGWNYIPSSENQNLLRRIEFVSDKIRCLRHNLLLEKGLIKPKVRPEGPDTYMEESTIQDFVMSKAMKGGFPAFKSDRLESDGADGGLHKEVGEMGRGKSATEERLMAQVTQEKKAEPLLSDSGDDGKGEMGRGNSAMEEQLPRIDSEAKMGLSMSVVESDRLILKPADPSPNILDSGGESMVKSDQLILEPALPCPDILDCGGDDKKDEMDKGKSAMEEQVPRVDSEFKPERGAESVMGLDTNEGMPMVKSDKLILESADPSLTNTMARLEQYSVQDDSDHNKMDRGETGTQLTMNGKAKAAKEMAHEAERFATYISYWESAWSRTCGFFIDQTALSSMQYTHYTPGRIPTNSAGSTPETLQIFSIKLAEIAGGLEWPLSVYGVVAARDIVDHNRNIIFSCIRSQAQELKHDDPFLRLTGPTRAIVCSDTVEFEIQLKVKGTTQSQDEALIRCARDCSGGFGHGVSTVCYKNSRCTLELCLQRVDRTVQATILGIQVVKGSWPFEYGGRVACSSLSGEIVNTDAGLARIINPLSSQIVLLDSKDGAKLKGFDGYLHVWRQVVSVGTRGELDVEIQAYTKSGDIATRGHVSFMTKFCNISQKKCALDGAEVLITVAWSLVPTERCLIVDDGSSRGNLV